jgi:hypothetical protein
MSLPERSIRTIMDAAIVAVGLLFCSLGMGVHGFTVVALHLMMPRGEL